MTEQQQQQNPQEEEKKITAETTNQTQEQQNLEENQDDKKFTLTKEQEETIKELASKNPQLYQQLMQQNERFKKRQFWDTQPVPKLYENIESQASGPLEKKEVKDVKQDPYALPEQFMWDNIDLKNQDQLEEVYVLLKENYVEDDDNMFRFDYSKDFLQWALLPPDGIQDWILGVRVKKNNKLVGFITGIPLKIHIEDKVVKMAEINFLCVFKKLRKHRLAPVLIKEVTRRINLKNVWQAVYTAGVQIPSPISKTQYFHRSLNPKKLIESSFSYLGPNQTIARLTKLYKLPEEPTLKELRPMQKKDVAGVSKLLATYFQKFSLHPEFNEQDVRYWLLPRENVIYSYVMENDKKEITDFISFYYLPSSILKHPKHTKLNAAYSYYNVATTVKSSELIQNALIYAKQKDFDVFNMLNIFDNQSVIKDLNFSSGDGYLHYYLYNWRVTQFLEAEKIGMVLV